MFTLAIVVSALIVLAVIAGAALDLLSRTELDGLDEACSTLYTDGKIDLDEWQRRLDERIDELQARGEWPSETLWQSLKRQKQERRQSNL